MGKFVICQRKDGFDFHLRAVNGEPIGTSPKFLSMDACITGIESVMHNAPIAHMEDQTVAGFQAAEFPKFQIYLDRDGKFCFRLIASDGKEILSSQTYTVKASCLNGIHSVMTNAPAAEIEEEE